MRGRGEGGRGKEQPEWREGLTGPHPVLSEFPLGLRSRPLPAAQLLSSTHTPCPCSTRPASLCPMTTGPLHLQSPCLGSLLSRCRHVNSDWFIL